MKNTFAIASLLALAIPSQVLADLVFSADFEIGDSEAAVGELLVRNEPVLKVEPTSMGDTNLGDHALLIDRELDQEFGLSFTIELSSPVALAGAGDLFVGARLPQLDQAYHVQISGSAFTPDQNPYSFTVDGSVLGDGDQRFLRLALGEAP